MNKLTNNLQDIFLNNARKNKIPVIIHLTNGFQIKGFVTGFDNFIVLFDCEGKQMMVYKHAMSTITPSKQILFTDKLDEYIEEL
ncbi:MAG TPA: RNA chaperone Hfq [Clostridiaceae bacterium]